MSQQKPKRATYDALPKKRMGAGCLIFDEQGRVLLVEPGYKPTWEIPGGVVELDESPKEACQREVQEELGLDIEIGRLLIVDYTCADDIKTESLMFVFDGGTFSKDDIAAIKLASAELLSYRFFEQQSLPDALSPTLRRRILAAWHQSQNPHTDSYLETTASP